MMEKQPGAQGWGRAQKGQSSISGGLNPRQVRAGAPALSRPIFTAPLCGVPGSRMEPLRRSVIRSRQFSGRPFMADLIFLASGVGLFAAFAAFAMGLRRV